MGNTINQTAHINALGDELSCNETREELSAVNNELDGCMENARSYPVRCAPWRYAEIFKNMTIRL